MEKLLLPASLLALGCSSEAPYLSTDTSTRDMSFQATAAGDAQGTTVTASLSGPGGTVYLTGEDRLSLRADGVDVPLIKGSSGSFEVTLGPGIVDLTLVLSRSAPDESAEMPLPMPPLTALHTDPSVSRTAPLVITWTPGDGTYESALSVTGACITPASRSLSVDPGTYAFQPADLASDAMGTCPITVRLERSKQGTRAAPPLRISNFSATQVMTRTLTSTP